MMDDRLLAALLGSVITLGIFVVGVFFKMGHHSARLESLEIWRANIRLDMHEISEELKIITNQVTKIMTILERRNLPRP